jgi:hypothetical protein
MVIEICPIVGSGQGWQACAPGERAQETFETEAELLQELAAEGFVDVTSEDLPDGLEDITGLIQGAPGRVFGRVQEVRAGEWPNPEYLGYTILDD